MRVATFYFDRWLLLKRLFQKRFFLIGVFFLLLASSAAVWCFCHSSVKTEVPQIDLGAISDAAVIKAIDHGIDDVHRSHRSVDAWGRLGLVLLAHDYVKESAKCFLEAEELDRADPRWPYFLAIGLLPDNPTASIGPLTRAADLYRDTPNLPRLRLGELLLEQGHQNEAYKNFLEVLAQDSNNPRARLGLARCAISSGNLDEALNHLQNIGDCLNARKAIHNLRTEVWQRRGNANFAASERHLAALAPNDPPWIDPFTDELNRYRTGQLARLENIEALVGQHRYEEAISLLFQLTQDYPKSESVWLALGKVLNMTRAYSDAEKALRSALFLNPNSEQAHFQLGVCLFEQGSSEGALEQFQKAVVLRPSFAVAFYNLGRCLQLCEDNLKAMEAFRSAIRARPPYTDAHRELARTLIRAGRPAEAITHLRQAIDLDPNDMDAIKLLDSLTTCLRH